MVSWPRALISAITAFSAFIMHLLINLKIPPHPPFTKGGMGEIFMFRCARAGMGVNLNSEYQISDYKASYFREKRGKGYSISFPTQNFSPCQ
jgi:hypothetical protein